MTIREIIKKFEEERQQLRDENKALKERVEELTNEKRALSSRLRRLEKQPKVEEPVVEATVSEVPEGLFEDTADLDVPVEKPRPQRRNRRKKVEE